MLRLRIASIICTCLVATNALSAEPSSTLLEGHQGTVRVALSSDGRTVATCSDDQTIRLWDVATQMVKHTLQVPRPRGVWRVDFSPDGQTLASASDQFIDVWNVDTGKGVLTNQLARDTIRAIRFTPSGDALLSGGNDETIRIWSLVNPADPLSEAAAPQELEHKRLGELNEVAWSIDVDPNGKWFAAGRGDGVGQAGTVEIRSLPDGKLLKTFDAPDKRQVWVVSVSPDGKLLAFGTVFGQVAILSTSDWSQVHAFNGGDDLRSMSFGHASVLAVGARNDIAIFDATTGERRELLKGHTNWVGSLDFAPSAGDGTLLLASGSTDKTARLWKLELKSGGASGK